MDSETTLELIKQLDEELKTIIPKYNGIITVEDDGDVSLTTNDFLITYSLNDKRFFLSFRVGKTGKRIAKITKCIVNKIDPSMILFGEDNHFDMKERKFYFGAEAVDARYLEVLENQNQFKCPYCDRVFSNSSKSESGICVLCDKQWNSTVWN